MKQCFSDFSNIPPRPSKGIQGTMNGLEVSIIVRCGFVIKHESLCVYYVWKQIIPSKYLPYPSIPVCLRVCLERHTNQPQRRPQLFTYDCIHNQNAFFAYWPRLDSGCNIWHKLLLESGECKCGETQSKFERRHAKWEKYLLDDFGLHARLHVHIWVQNLSPKLVESNKESGMQRPQGLLQSMFNTAAFLIDCNIKKIITLLSMDIFKWPVIN